MKLGPFMILLSMSSISSPAMQEELPDAPDQTIELKAISKPIPPYPEEAQRRHIEGKVALSIVVDASGNVADAKVLSGPQELAGAALAAVNAWRYEPPISAPVTKTVWITFGFPKDCPGKISDQGSVEWSWDLRNTDGKRIATIADSSTHLPPYPEEERKSGVAGIMALLINLNPDGNVKNVKLVKSLSPALDKAFVDAARAWRFKLLYENASLEDLRLQFRFRSLCSPEF
jgi:TonB family protein